MTDTRRWRLMVNVQDDAVSWIWRGGSRATSKNDIPLDGRIAYPAPFRSALHPRNKPISQSVGSRHDCWKIFIVGITPVSSSFSHLFVLHDGVFFNVMHLTSRGKRSWVIFDFTFVIGSWTFKQAHGLAYSRV